MSGSLFIFTRPVPRDGMPPAKQIITAFANDLGTAKNLVEGELARFRAEKGGDWRNPAFQALPEFLVEERPLDEPRIITSAVT